MTGWIKAHRQMRSSPMLATAVRKGVWLDLLLMAAHGPTSVSLRGRSIELRAGQCAVVMADWAKSLGLTPRQLERIICAFVADGMIAKSSTAGKACTLIEVCNYKIYQAPSFHRGGTTGESDGRWNDGGTNGGTTVERTVEGGSPLTHDSETENPPDDEDAVEGPVQNRWKGRFKTGGSEQEEQESKNLYNGHSHDSKPADLERAFAERFWPSYPKKVGKAAAKSKFVTQAKRYGVDALMEGLERANAEWHRRGTEARFIPNPLTWLNQGRWEDEPEPVRQRHSVNPVFTL